MKDFLDMNLLQGAFDFDSMEDDQIAKDLKGELSDEELKEIAPKASPLEQNTTLNEDFEDIDKNDPLYEYKKAKEYEREQMELNEYIQDNPEVYEDDEYTSDEEDTDDYDYDDLVDDDDNDEDNNDEDNNDEDIDYSDLIDDNNDFSNDYSSSDESYGDFNIDSILDEAEQENKKELEQSLNTQKKVDGPSIYERAIQLAEGKKQAEEHSNEDSYFEENDNEEDYFGSNEEDNQSDDENYFDEDEDYFSDDEDLSQYVEDDVSVIEAKEQSKVETEAVIALEHTGDKKNYSKDNENSSDDEGYFENSDDNYFEDDTSEDEDLSQYIEEDSNDGYFDEDEDLSEYLDDNNETEVQNNNFVEKESYCHETTSTNAYDKKEEYTEKTGSSTVEKKESADKELEYTVEKKESLNEKDHSKKESIVFLSKKEQEMQEQIRLLELEKQMLQQQFELEMLRKKLQQTEQGDEHKNEEIPKNNSDSTIINDSNTISDTSASHVQNNTKKPGVVKQNSNNGKKLLTIEDFDGMDESILIRYVESYMIKQGVRGQLIDKNLLTDKFGAANIKRLLRKNKLISFRGGITLAV